MTAREVVEKLVDAGFSEHPGRHHTVLKHKDGRKTCVPRHKGDLPIGTLKAIEKQSKVKLS